MAQRRARRGRQPGRNVGLFSGGHGDGRHLESGVDQAGRGGAGAETKAKGAHVLLAPTVNIHRTPNAGRNFECFAEDPFLSGTMAAAYINGLQKAGVSACIKHFVANDQEFERFSISSEVAERPLHEMYLEPFRIALEKANPWTS
jgi:beta-glucosidase-like glycosyl hydrolase